MLPYDSLRHSCIVIKRFFTFLSTFFFIFNGKNACKFFFIFPSFFYYKTLKGQCKDKSDENIYYKKPMKKIVFFYSNLCHITAHCYLVIRQKQLKLETKFS